MWTYLYRLAGERGRKPFIPNPFSIHGSDQLEGGVRAQVIRMV